MERYLVAPRGSQTQLYLPILVTTLSTLTASFTAEFSLCVRADIYFIVDFDARYILHAQRNEITVKSTSQMFLFINIILQKGECAIFKLIIIKNMIKVIMGEGGGGISSLAADKNFHSASSVHLSFTGYTAEKARGEEITPIGQEPKIFISRLSKVFNWRISLSLSLPLSFHSYPALFARIIKIAMGYGCDIAKY